MISQILGGVGLFLLGMIMMTDGLKAAAGDAMKTVLARFTGGPFRGMLSGAALTAVVQSSSATTLATIGFVSAGLLTFPSALGVILGINIGTTSTGWIVSMLGLKLKVAVIAMPLVGIGALARLLLKGKPAAYGTALAGFGLIFVGIDVLQVGMADLATRIDPSRFPQDPYVGRLILVIVGVVMTVIMQSSSAAVATTLTALHSEAITLPQAAALVIGQNLGTKVKVIIASIGGSVAVKRTAAAHIIFNLVTVFFALLILPLFLIAVPHVLDLSYPDSNTLAIAFFHTAFNVLGVALFLPFVHPFAAFIMRIVPEKEDGPKATRFLDPSVAVTGAVGVEVARRALVRILRDLTMVMNTAARLPEPFPPNLEEHRLGLEQTRNFLARIGAPQADGESGYRQQLSLMHSLDHLDRLTDAVSEVQHEEMIRISPELRNRLAETTQSLYEHLQPLEEFQELDLPVESIRQLSLENAEWRRKRREILLEESARGDRDPKTTLDLLEATRWIDRISYHSWRTLHHLAEQSTNPPPDEVHNPASMDNA